MPRRRERQQVPLWLVGRVEVEGANVVEEVDRERIALEGEREVHASVARRLPDRVDLRRRARADARVETVGRRGPPDRRLEDAEHEQRSGQYASSWRGAGQRDPPAGQ